MPENPDDVIDEAEQYSENVRDVAVDAVEVFIANEGELYEFGEAVELISVEVGCDKELASDVVSHLASDHVDPVINVASSNGRYVGVKEYVGGDWYYGYRDYDDNLGEGWRVVCMQCVHEKDRVEDVGTAFEHDLEGEFESLEGIEAWMKENHFDKRHERVSSSSVGRAIGASLATGTTIATNTAWHDGNVTAGSNISVSNQTIGVSPQGGGSGLNADRVDGSHANELGGAVVRQVFQKKQIAASAANNTVVGGPLNSYGKATSTSASFSGSQRVSANADVDVLNYNPGGTVKIKVAGNTIASDALENGTNGYTERNFNVGDKVVASFHITQSVGDGNYTMGWNLSISAPYI